MATSDGDEEYQSRATTGWDTGFPSVQTLTVNLDDWNECRTGVHDVQRGVATSLACTYCKRETFDATRPCAGCGASDFAVRACR